MLRTEKNSHHFTFRSSVTSVVFEKRFASSNGSVMDPLLMPLRIGTILAIETVRLTGIQSLYILKMWQFDYAFRYYQCSIGKTEVRISSRYKEITFRFVLAMKTFHSVHNAMLIITNVRLERFSHDSSELRHYCFVPITQINRDQMHSQCGSHTSAYF
ncbi:hypothetical protein TSPI_06300 [Trichinella spiralis]|uniref:Uncharacterized protein n=1 Tax=Trichinella spiralis TaxID=6334 RepID=A0ABR3KUV0_TRISP